VLHLFCWICFWLLCVEKKENKTKQNKPQTPPLSFPISSSAQPSFPAQLLSPLFFPPPYQKQAASPTCSSGPIANASPLHPLPLSLSLTPRPHVRPSPTSRPSSPIRSSDASPSLPSSQVSPPWPPLHFGVFPVVIGGREALFGRRR
jgi:hypothetical protein